MPGSCTMGYAVNLHTYARGFVKRRLDCTLPERVRRPKGTALHVPWSVEGLC